MGRGLISEDLINQIRDRVDITEVVRHHVSLAKAGQNFRGLCPFHQEKTPSFNVSPSRQIFHCFGCGVGGNVFTFLMKVTGATFPEAVRELGRRVGIEVADSPGGDYDRKQVNTRRLADTNAAAAAWFRRMLHEDTVGKEARAYLASRGMVSETIDRFGLGFAPTQWEGVAKALSSEGFRPEELTAAGLTIPRDQSGRTNMVIGKGGVYDRFRGRLMFPIVDLHKRVVGFGGRVIGEGTPKYLNSPDTPLFKKGQTLFALEAARTEASRLRSLIVVEGYFDAVALHQVGMCHTVATLGTALTPDHVHMIRRFASTLVLLFDPDQAGVRAALRSLDLVVNSGLSVKVVSLPEGDDPDTFVRTRGRDGFMHLLEHAPSLLDFAVEHSLRAGQSGTVEDRIRSVDEVLRILQKSEHPIEREERIRMVAERLGLNQQRLIERYPALVARVPGRVPSRLAHAEPARKVAEQLEERDLVHLVLQGAMSLSDLHRVPIDAVTGGAHRTILLCALELAEREGHVPIRALLDRVLEDPDCRELATELSLSEVYYDDVPAHVTGCVAKLERRRADAVLKGLIAKLRAAERDGRDEDARCLNRQVNELRMKKAGFSTSALPPQ